MPTTSRLQFGVVILGAGTSTRMGQPKLLLPWAGTTVLGHLLAQWRALGARQIAVVCAANGPVPTELDRLAFDSQDRIVNPRPDQGMFSSIQCAARWPCWNGQLTHWVIALGDQPHLRPDSLRALLDFAAGHPECICQPSRQARPRHPVLLPATTFARLKDSRDANLKQFLQASPPPVQLCELDDPGLDLDLDQPSDYEAALTLTGPQASLLPLPTTEEWGEGRGEGKSMSTRPSSPRPSPPSAGGEGEENTRRR